MSFVLYHRSFGIPGSSIVVDGVHVPSEIEIDLIEVW
jgi:hypothetical protein